MASAVRLRSVLVQLETMVLCMRQMRMRMNRTPRMVAQPG